MTARHLLQESLRASALSSLFALRSCDDLLHIQVLILKSVDEFVDQNRLGSSAGATTQ